MANPACLPLAAGGGGACFHLGGRDEDCLLTGACQMPLQCDVAAVDSAGDIIAAACHQPCGPNQTCTATERCLPSTPGYVEVQRDTDGGSVSCTPGMPSPQCNAMGRYRCAELSNGGFCVTDVTACGTAVPPADTRKVLGAFGDAGTLTPEETCSLGTEAPGSHFCDTFADELAQPLRTICTPVPPATSSGICVAFCDNATPCPGNYHCERRRERAVFISYVDADPILDGTQVQTCTDDSSCTALDPAAFCGGPFSVDPNPICVVTVGQCQPGAFSPPPAAFTTKRTLLEMSTGDWCGWCLDGDLFADAIQTANPGQVIGVRLHDPSAGLSSPASQARLTYHSISSFPYGVIDGTSNGVGRRDWAADTAARLAVDPVCGLAINAADAAAIEVRAACESTPTMEVRLNIWSIEAAVSGPPQANYYNTTAGHPFFGAGDPIVDYVSPNVLRGFLTANTNGEVIDVSAGVFSRTVDGSGLCTDTDCIVVAFVTLFDAASGFHVVDSVRWAAYGASADWAP